jgi:hypothetical protein
MLNDLYELSLIGTLFNQEVSNVFHYRQALEFATTNPTHAQALAEGFRDQKMTALRALSSGDLVYTDINVRNLYDGADQYNLPVSLPGTGSSAGVADTLGSFTALSFTLQPETNVTKQGAKRFAGVFEAQQTDGVVTDTNILTTHAPAASAAITSPVTVGLVIPDDVFIPVLVKRIRSGSPGGYSYRLPTNAAEGQWSRIVVALFNAIVTSQVSRKIGVGI